MQQEFDNSQNWHSRGFIPHYDANLKYQMITYRLADALPRGVLPGSTGGPPVKNKTDEKENALKQRQLVESILDKGYGCCVLKIPSIAKLVIDNWRYFDKDRYDLISYVVMPNHVHILIKVSLSEIVHS